MLEPTAQCRITVQRGQVVQQLPGDDEQHGMPASSYRIRKAHKPGQLSTLEATCAALAEMESNAGSFALLLAAFDGFVVPHSGSRAQAEATDVIALVAPE